MPKYKKTLFVFRRDLRLHDNTGLLFALESSASVLPVFIFDPRQIKDNQYFSAPAFQFMLQSLEELDQVLQGKQSALHCFSGAAQEVIAKLIETEKFDAVVVNKDYTPFSVDRDLAIAEVCRIKNVDFQAFDDALLNGPDAVSKNDGGVYTVFTPYFRKASTLPVREPRKNSLMNYAKPSSGLNARIELKQFKKADQPAWAIKGGRREALQILSNVVKYRNYNAVRDTPSLDATTHLSAHMKFGTCSPREIFCAISRTLGSNHPLLRQLYWRDFFAQVGFHHPYVLGRSFHEKYDKIVWENDQKKFQLWCEGRTGFPLVDAGMRELNVTGYMHNRVRMVTASFLVKDLHIDWRWGEKYFAQKLVDYDPLVNNGNWQWAASTGCDAQPYFRIFNPWLQQERFDPDCVYIKRWLPELGAFSAKQIHRIASEPLLRPDSYPAPVADHKKASEAAKKFFRAC
jgi:deoxyribodipyrimidine photo-lyase